MSPAARVCQQTAKSQLEGEGSLHGENRDTERSPKCHVTGKAGVGCCEVAGCEVEELTPEREGKKGQEGIRQSPSGPFPN